MAGYTTEDPLNRHDESGAAVPVPGEYERLSRIYERAVRERENEAWWERLLSADTIDMAGGEQWAR